MQCMNYWFQAGSKTSFIFYIKLIRSRTSLCWLLDPYWPRVLNPSQTRSVKKICPKKPVPNLVFRTVTNRVSYRFGGELEAIVSFALVITRLIRN